MASVPSDGLAGIGWPSVGEGKREMILIAEFNGGTISPIANLRPTVNQLTDQRTHTRIFRQSDRIEERKRRLCVKNKLTCALALFICIAGLAAGPAIKKIFAQTATNSQSGIDQNIQLLRQDIRSKKKQLVAANLNLTETEATKFWPAYDQYTADLAKIHDERVAVIKEYADNWGKMSDDQALSLTNRALAIEKNVADLRIRYVPIFSKVIPGTKVATFFQIDRRIQGLIDIQLSSQLPLVQQQQ